MSVFQTYVAEHPVLMNAGLGILDLLSTIGRVCSPKHLDFPWNENNIIYHKPYYIFHIILYYKTRLVNANFTSAMLTWLYNHTVITSLNPWISIIKFMSNMKKISLASKMNPVIRLYSMILCGSWFLIENVTVLIFVTPYPYLVTSRKTHFERKTIIADCDSFLILILIIERYMIYTHISKFINPNLGNLLNECSFFFWVKER